MKVHSPELVCPAGEWPSLITAVENGADSVYFGVKGLNMRNLAANFDVFELKKVMKFLHEKKKKGYLALNVIVYDQDIEKVTRILKEAKAAKVDAVILWDMAVFALAKKFGLRVHLSTQASVSNRESLKFYSRLGIKRIVLARECSLSDIRRTAQYVKKQKIPCEIETFIHGAMCVSISGRCFLSQESFNKSANRGECLQPCRREYEITAKDGEARYILGPDYILSPKDLCSIDFIDELIKAGIHSFKIEGRMRPPEYIRVVAAAYRRAIDAFGEGQLTDELKQELKAQLATVYNRGFSSGFYLGAPGPEVSRKLEHSHKKVFLGEVRKFYSKINVADVMVRNGPVRVGDQILFSGKSTPVSVTTVTELQQNHLPVNEAAKGQAVGVKVPFTVRRKDKVFFWREENQR